MIFDRKKKQKLDKSLCKLHPKYTYELQEKKEHYAMILRRTLLISLAVICICSLALIFISSTIGVHETIYTLPSGEIIVTHSNVNLYLNNQKLEGIKTNDNTIAFFISIGIFFGNLSFGTYYLIRNH